MNKELLLTLKIRFNNNMHRHPNLKWDAVEDLLLKNESHLKSIELMELTKGEPDVITFDNKTISYVDFSKETPLERRSLCYDKEALDKRKSNKPISDAVTEANKMKIALLSEKEYRYLQTFEHFDLKTSSWILTPPEIRKLGGALFCDNRYNQVFVYHNGADSYYSSRGFRGKINLN